MNEQHDAVLNHADDRYIADNAAYRRGRDDCKEGKQVGDNPYTSMRDRDCWEMGWLYINHMENI